MKIILKTDAIIDTQNGVIVASAGDEVDVTEEVAEVLGYKEKAQTKRKTSAKK